jgi:glycosyltransferase involved in cell wall biosynthesis
MDSSSLPLVSVIVPVYNDPVRLRACLEALESQSYPSGSYEVIVVDNNSDEPIDGVVDPYPHASAEFELKQGSYAARNRGIEAAEGDLLAFTDADCIPDRSWVETGIRRLQSEDDMVGIVGGEIEVMFENPQAPRPAEVLDAMTGFSQKAVCTKRDFSATANLFTTRDVIDEAGPFDASLKSAGDKEFGRRVVRHGYRIVFEPEAIVRHPARRTPRALFKKRYRLAKGQYDLRVQQGAYPIAELAVDAANHLRPMKGMIPQILRDSRFASPADRVRGLLIYILMELIFPFEKIRLWMSGRGRSQQ